MIHFEKTQTRREIKRMQSRSHQLGIQEVNKNSLSLKLQHIVIKIKILYSYFD